MYDFVGLGILIALILLSGGLAWWAWRARRLWMRLLGGIPATLLACTLLAAFGLALVGYQKVNRVYPNPVPDVQVELTPERIARGEKFARTCAGCHAPNSQFPMVGSNFIAEGPPLGTLWAPNLTMAQLRDWSDGELIRAIREGIGRDGRSLMIMPSDAFRNLSDEDVQALVAYLRNQPAVEPPSPPRQINVVGAFMLGALIPDAFFTAQPALAGPVEAPPAGRTPEYGRYLSSLGCQHCHGADFQGLPHTNEPPGGPSLRAAAQNYSEAQFVAMLRTGTRLDGSRLSAEMPWPDLEKFSDDDFAAMYLYFRALK
ncbi:MAG: c-type cytochrome [Chloroflexaceae bacterium]|jgi:mono/diheme cytochrome c family protein|nr:c-type cytochrome [Chloroflexaceae bacterium]